MSPHVARERVALSAADERRIRELLGLSEAAAPEPSEGADACADGITASGAGAS